MSRTLGTAFAVAFSGLALALTATATATATPPKTVQGTVGPGFTIKLTLAGKKVTKLKKGVRYRFQIRDRSASHDFHLIGPGVNRVLTSVEFTGTKSIMFTLRKGTYRFICDPHASFMHGSFRVA
jgi:plastocyanin